MKSNIFERLQKYDSDIVSVLKEEASIASVFPNSTDKGLSREETYLKILSAHLPSSCTLMLLPFDL